MVLVKEGLRRWLSRGYLAFFLGLLPLGVGALDQVVMPPFWQKGESLPVGQSRGAVMIGYQSSTRVWNESGSSRPLGTERVRTVSLGEEVKRTVLHRYRIRREDSVVQPLLFYGLSSSVTLGARAPIYFTTLSRRESIEPQDGQGPLSSLEREEASMAQQSQSLASLEEGHSRARMGDVRILGQWTPWHSNSSEQLRFALQPELAVPTARNSTPSTWTSITEYEGQWDLGLTSILSQRFKTWLEGAISVGYLHQAGDRVRWRDDHGVHLIERDFGDIVHASLWTQWQWYSNWSVSWSMRHEWKSEDSYKSDHSDSRVTDWLMEGSSYRVLVTRITGRYRLARLGRQVLVGQRPLWAGLTVEQPLLGRNRSPDAAYFLTLQL